MKIATKIAGFLMSCVTLCTALQPVASMAQNTEMARPRSTIDLSRTDRLTGTPGFADTPGCPSGQVLSGGACVLISNQATGVPSWTSYFVGQQKCVGQSCIAILQDGRLQLLSSGRSDGIHDVPFENNVASFTWGDWQADGGYMTGTTMYAQPILINTNKTNFYGTRPEVADWFVTIR